MFSHQLPNFVAYRIVQIENRASADCEDVLGLHISEIFIFKWGRLGACSRGKLTADYSVAVSEGGELTKSRMLVAAVVSVVFDALEETVSKVSLDLFLTTLVVVNVVDRRM